MSYKMYYSRKASMAKPMPWSLFFLVHLIHLGPVLIGLILAYIFDM